MYCLNASTGVMLWKFYAYDVVHTATLSADGAVLFFGSEDNNVYALLATPAATSERLYWKHITGDTVYSTPVLSQVPPRPPRSPVLAIRPRSRSPERGKKWGEKGKKDDRVDYTNAC